MPSTTKDTEVTNVFVSRKILCNLYQDIFKGHSRSVTLVQTLSLRADFCYKDPCSELEY